ncbi:MAG: lipoyl(octanoyl) transferase, partial [Planctomycetes bacterium]|nr:lipoyl(octanoyl) transferase [Planctomycetota bacterium]
IEGNLIRVLAAFGLEGHRIPGRTGVFCQGHKIVSIGVGVRHWVTYHGFALNRCVDLEIYRHFRPCGLDGDIMTDLSQLLGHVPQDTQVMDHVAHVFRSPGPMKS